MKIEFIWVGTATFVININNTLKIACDPCLVPKDEVVKFSSFSSTRLQGAKYDKNTFKNIDIWLLTHNHLDHLDDYGKKVIEEDAKIICCKNVFEELKGKDVSVLDWEEEKVIQKGKYKIKIIAIPAYHGNNIIMRKIIGKVNGYFLKISDDKEEKTIYITSDTVYHKSITKIFKDKNVDVLIANVGEALKNMFGGPITMSPSMLNKVKEDINPKKIIPIHYDDFSHFINNKDALNLAGYTIYERGKVYDLNIN